MYSTRRPALPTALTVATLAALLVGLAATLPAPAQLRQEQVQPQPAAPRPQAPRDAAPDAPTPQPQPTAQDPAAAQNAPPEGEPPAQPAQPGDAPTDARTDDADRAIAQEEAKVDPSYLEPVLAERLAELAQSNLRQKTVTAPMWRQSGALLEAATRLNPREPRLARLLVEARMKM